MRLHGDAGFSVRGGRGNGRRSGAGGRPENDTPPGNPGARDGRGGAQYWKKL